MTTATSGREDQRLRATEQTTETLLTSIHKISTLLTRPLSLDRILTSIVKETCQVFGFTRMAIFLTDIV